jgi:hypothetical protein
MGRASDNKNYSAAPIRNLRSSFQFENFGVDYASHEGFPLSLPYRGACGKL